MKLVALSGTLTPALRDELWYCNRNVVFVAADRENQLAPEGYNPIAPDLVVEVISPTERQTAIRRKLAIYAEADVVRLVYPARRIVEVYAPDQPVEIMGMDNVLDGCEVLPGFSLPVRDIFETGSKAENRFQTLLVRVCIPRCPAAN